MRLADAAEQVLLDAGEPLHYTEITTRVIRRGLWPGTPGKTPWFSLHRAITEEVRQKGRRCRFDYERGKGNVWMRKRRTTPAPRPIEAEVQGQGAGHAEPLARTAAAAAEGVRQELRQWLYEVEPDRFEKLVGTLLQLEGFEEIEIVGRPGDGGVDVRCKLATPYLRR